MSPKPYHFTGFGDIYGPKPYYLIGFGDIYGPKPYYVIGFGKIYGPKPHYLIGFGDIYGHVWAFFLHLCWVSGVWLVSSSRMRAAVRLCVL